MSAPQVVAEIMSVLKARGGFDHWWDEIDPETQEEIIEELQDVAGRWVS